MKTTAPLLLCLLGIIACTTTRHAPQQDTAVVTRLAQQLMQAWQTGDPEEIDQLFAENATYEDVPNNHTFRGRDGAKQYVGHVHSWASNLTIDVVAIHASEATATVEWVMRGTQAHPIAERFPLSTGRAFELRGATLIEVENGEISRAADYMNVASFLAQLGVRFELPDQ